MTRAKMTIVVTLTLICVSLRFAAVRPGDDSTGLLEDIKDSVTVRLTGQDNMLEVITDKSGEHRIHTCMYTPSDASEQPGTRALHGRQMCGGRLDGQQDL